MVNLQKPFISVITSVKNGERYLEKTILSLTKFNNDNLELIIIDGNSEDGTVDIIRSYEHYISYWKTEPDNGLYEGYNKGWEVAKKDSYVLFLGAGDKLIDIPTEELNIKYNQIVCGRVDIGRKQMFISRVNYMSKFANTLHHQGLLVPKKLHVEPPFNTNYRVYADFDFNQRLIKKGATFRYSDKFLAYAMPGGVSEKYSNESFLIAYKNFGLAYGLMACLFYLYQKGKQYGKRIAR